MLEIDAMRAMAPLWAGGTVIDVSALLKVSVDELIRLSQRHRMTAFVNLTLGRLAVREPALEPYRKAIAERHDRNVAGARAMIRELYHLVDTVEAMRGVIVLKGNRDLLLGEPDTFAKESFDIDFMADDPEGRRAGLEAAGYMNDEQSSRGLPAHEFINFFCNGVAFDGHRWFPVCSPVAAPGSSLPAGVTFGRLTSDDVLSHAIECRTETGRGSFVVPNSSLSAFMMIAAVYRDYVQSGFPDSQSRPPVRVGEILVIDRLLQRDDFDFGEFSALFETTGLSRDVLRWYLDVVKVILPETAKGVAAMEAACPPRAGRAQAIGTIYHRYWFGRGDLTLEALVSHPSPEGWRAATAAGSARLRLHPGTEPNFVPADVEGVALPTFGAAAPPNLAVKHDGKALTVRIETRWMSPETRKRILVRVDESLYHLYFSASAKPSTLTAKNAAYALQPRMLGDELVEVDFDMNGAPVSSVSFISASTCEYSSLPDEPEYVTVTPVAVSWAD